MKKIARPKTKFRMLIASIVVFIFTLSTVYITDYSFSTASAISGNPPAKPTPTANASFFHTAPLNPEFIDYIDNPPDSPTGYIPPPMDLSLIPEVTQTATVNGVPVVGANPGLSYFDWRDTGKVTSVKDQNPCGTCWAFGTLSAFESMVLIGESVSYNFSEQNLVCCTDPSIVFQHDDHCNAGGNSFMAADTLSKKGTRLESCQPYNTGTINTESCNDSCATIKVLNGYRLITNDGSQISTIKDAIYDYGPVSMAYWVEPGNVDHYLYSGNIYYYPSCPYTPNHMVSIVGWNDSIPHPSGGGYGAWIVKNNWGTSWGDNGYFYLCYGSANMRSVASFLYLDYNSNEKLYYWDEAGWVANFGGEVGDGVDYGWMASVFSSTQNGNITSVDFWTPSSNAQYQIYIYDNSFGTQLTYQSGTCQEAGYYSIALNSPVHRNDGQQFTVAMKITTPGYNWPIPIEYVDTGIFEPPIQTSVSYLKIEEDDDWDDAANYEWNVCLRARIVDDSFNLTLNASPALGGTVTDPGIGSFGPYIYGQAVPIVAAANSCYHFVGWTGDTAYIANTSASSTTITMYDGYSVTANFAIDTFTLTYNSGSGGSVSGTTPQTVDCYSDGSAVTAIPDPCYYFVNWSDASTENPRTDTDVTGDITVTANFAPTGATYNLTINSSEYGNVSIPGEGPSGPYTCGSSVNLSAIADSCCGFVNWTGDIDSIANPDAATTTITMNGSKTIQANFIVTPWDVNCEGAVNVLDMILIGQHWGQTGAPGWIPEDVNGDGTVNVLDMILVGQHWTG